jgi:hypothetical protein
MKSLARIFTGAMFILFSNLASSDPYDGQGDTESSPDVWITPVDSENGNSGVLIMPGDNQPVTSTREGNVEVINYDNAVSPDSEPVIIDDSMDE